MPNRAANIRAAVQAAHPGSTVESRGDRWLHHRLPDGTNALDVTVGRLHYDGEQEVDTDIVDATVPEADDMVTTAPYEFYQRDGDRRLYPRRGVQTEYIELGRPEFQRPNLTWAAVPWDGKSRAGNVITYERVDARLEIVTGPERLKINLVLLSLPTSTRWRFPATLVGLTRQGRALIAASDGASVAWLAPFSLVDAAGIERNVPDQLSGHPTYQGAYVIEPDLSGLTYPVVIDPTIDVNITATGNDGGWSGSGSFSTTSTTVAIGSNASVAQNAFIRFVSVAIPNAATLTTAQVNFVAGSTLSTTTVNLNIYGENVDSAAAITSTADANARAVTAAAAWNAVTSWTSGVAVSTPSLLTPVQAVVNRAGWASGNAMQILIKNNGSSATAFRQPAAWDHASLTEPVLHVEYADPPGQPTWTRRGGVWSPGQQVRRVGDYGRR